MKITDKHSEGNCNAAIPKNYQRGSGIKQQEMSDFWELSKELDYPFVYIQILPERKNLSIEWLPVLIVVNPSQHGSPATLIDLTVRYHNGEITLDQAVEQYHSDKKRFREFAKRNHCPECRKENEWNSEPHEMRTLICSVDFVTFKFPNERD